MKLKTYLSSLAMLVIVLGLHPLVAKDYAKKDPNERVRKAEEKYVQSQKCRHHHHHHSSSSSSLKDIKKCCRILNAKQACQFVIRERDLNPNGFVITKSGYYCLEKNSIFNPVVPNGQAIRITTSDVVLDLNGKTLSESSKTITDTNGITVDPNLSNITIMNGTVIGFSKVGIFAGKNSSLLKISQITSTNNGVRQQAGLFASGSGGLYITGSRDIIVENSWFVGNAGAGANFDDVSKVIFENNHCDDQVSAFLVNSTPPPFSNVALGAGFNGVVTGCSDVVIRNCTFNRNASEVLARGLSIRRSVFTTQTPNNTNFVIENCEMNDNKINLTNDVAINIGSSAVGISLNATNNVVIRNCSIFNNSSQASTALPLRSFGVDLFVCDDVLVEDCVASGHIQSSVSTATTFAMACGFKITQCNRNIFRRCVASNNINPVGEAYGFAMNNPIFGGALRQDNQVVFENCIAENNIGASGIGAGFNLRNALNSKILNCLAQGNTIGLLTDEQKLPPPDSLTDNNVVANNIFVANIQFGILDTTTNKSTAYYKNEAKKNGPTP